MCSIGKLKFILIYENKEKLPITPHALY